MGISREESERQIAELRAKDRAKAEQKTRDRALDAADAKHGPWVQEQYHRDMVGAKDAYTRAEAMHGKVSTKAELDDEGRRFVRVAIPGRRNRVKVSVPDTPGIRALFEEIRAEFGDVAPFDCFIPIDRWAALGDQDPTKDHRLTPYHAAVAWAARQEGPEPKTGFVEGVRQVIANLPKEPGTGKP